LLIWYLMSIGCSICILGRDIYFKLVPIGSLLKLLQQCVTHGHTVISCGDICNFPTSTHSSIHSVSYSSQTSIERSRSVLSLQKGTLSKQSIISRWSNQLSLLGLLLSVKISQCRILFRKGASWTCYFQLLKRKILVCFMQITF
jgi:hypothetical protein